MMRRCFAIPLTTASAAAPLAAARWVSVKNEDIPSHFRATTTPHPLYDKPERLQQENVYKHPKQVVYTPEELNVEQTHTPPKDTIDRIAFGGVKLLRLAFDLVSGYKFGKVTEPKLLRRILFLETAAGIPGMVAGTLRHLRSLRVMERDHGWIHTLLEEAENERMHMLVFMQEHKPGYLFRALVLVTQGIFWNTFFVCYLLCPRLCHRFVGYLEEEATRTYTHALGLMEDKEGHPDLYAMARRPASRIAKDYWRLADDAQMIDVVRAVRADEANHRDVNHTFAGIPADAPSPFNKH